MESSRAQATVEALIMLAAFLAIISLLLGVHVQNLEQITGSDAGQRLEAWGQATCDAHYRAIGGDREYSFECPHQLTERRWFD